MKVYIYISAGGFIGSIFRYITTNINWGYYSGNFPIGTLFVNIIGAFLLLIISTFISEYFHIDDYLKKGIVTGFFGAYTTFSTLCKETNSLIINKYYADATVYLILSILLGIGATYSGFFIAHKLITNVIKKKDKI